MGLWEALDNEFQSIARARGRAVATAQGPIPDNEVQEDCRRSDKIYFCNNR